MCVCVWGGGGGVFWLFTPFLSVLPVSQEEPSLTASNQQIYDFSKQIIFEKKRHCGK